MSVGPLLCRGVKRGFAKISRAVLTTHILGDLGVPIGLLDRVLSLRCLKREFRAYLIFLALLNGSVPCKLVREIALSP